MKISKINVILDNLKANKSLEEVDVLNEKDMLCEINSFLKESVYIISVSGRTTQRKFPRKPHVTEAHKE